jgi:hypothetical protein
MDNDQTPAWLPLGEASQRLATTVDALRKQIRRGRLQSRKGNDGRLLVLVPGGQPVASPVQDSGRTVASPVQDEDRTVASLLDKLDRTRLDLEQLQATVLTLTERAARAEGANAALREFVDELKQQLAAARTPWWKRWLG